MRTILLSATAALALAACGGGDSAHDVITCPTAWDSITNVKCETACGGGPICAANDDACQQALPLCKVNDTQNCFADRVATYEGQRVCCTADAQRVVRAIECEGE